MCLTKKIFHSTQHNKMLLGQGVTAKVYHHVMEDGSSVARKRFHKIDEKEFRLVKKQARRIKKEGFVSTTYVSEFLTEVNVLSQLRNDCIIRVLAFEANSCVDVFITLPYYSNGSLLTYRGNKKLLNTSGIPGAIQAIHNIGYVHSDIAPKNLLVDNLGRLVLGDFGSAFNAFPFALYETAIDEYNVGSLAYRHKDLFDVDNRKEMYYQKRMPNEDLMALDYWSFNVVKAEIALGIKDELFYYKCPLPNIGATQLGTQMDRMVDDLIRHILDTLFAIVDERPVRYEMRELANRVLCLDGWNAELTRIYSELLSIWKPNDVYLMYKLKRWVARLQREFIITRIDLFNLNYTLS